MTPPTPADAEQLQASLDAAVAAASEAYRSSTQLIRVLTVLGQPSTPETLVEQTLIVLSQVFSADVAALVRAVDGRLVATSSCGLTEDDPAHDTGWPLAGGAADALAARREMQRFGAALRPDDVPPALADADIGSAVWVPLSTGPESGDELLFLARRVPRPITPTELQVLGSVAARLAAVLEARAHATAVEQLARSGHRLSRYLEPAELLAEAARMLPELLAADVAHLVLVDGERIAGSASSDPADPDLPPAATGLAGWAEASHGEPFRGVCPHRLTGLPRSVLCVPVLRDEGPVAFVYVERDGRRPFPAHAVEIACIFANYFNAAMRNAELYLALRSSEAELRQRATHDPLTGLANRALTSQRLEHALAADGPSHVGLLFCDLDRFKQVNDRLGHEAGDELLLTVAERLGRGLRPGDLLARFGGDEFVVLLDGIEGLSAIQEIGRRLVELLERPFSLRGERVEISVSVGGVLGKRGRTSAGELLRDADAAMYTAKRRGPGQVEVFDDAASTHSLTGLELRSDLRSALQRGELHLVYQPIVGLRGGRVYGFEALLRWNHPHRGPIAPDVFIPLAEDSGAIAAIGDWVLAEACRQLAAWHRLPGLGGLEINVNVSPSQFAYPDFADRTLATIRRSGVGLHNVWLELTEHGSVDAATTELVGKLHEAGIRFALDDFGIAHSNLNHLRNLPIGGLKIDRSFVAGMTANEMDEGIVRAVLAMADSLNLSVVAEGIETTEQQAALMSLGCPRGQGFLLARPMPAADATALLTHGRREPALAG